MLLYPSAFNMTTGPLHWELLQRARANDLQLFVSMVSPARDNSAEYIAWGHTMVVDPWGKVIATAQESEEIIVTDLGKSKKLSNKNIFSKIFFSFLILDTSLVQKVREQIPVSKQRRLDLYETNSKFDAE